MKKDFREVQNDYKSQVVGLCLSCEKVCHNWWGRIGNAGVCGSKCQQAYNASTSLKNADLRPFTKGS